LEQSVNTVFNGFPKFQESKYQEMSSLTARLLSAGKRHYQIKLEDCLAHFLSLFCGCFVVGSEIQYLAPRDDHFLHGKLDCILEDRTVEESKYIIVDFKSGDLPKRADCTGTGDELKDFQLPMYITLAEENEKIKIHAALFYDILKLNPEVFFGTIEDKFNEKTIPQKADNRILCNGENHERYDQVLIEFIKKTKKFAGEIKNVSFTVFESDYNKCNKCEYNRICRTTYIIGREKNISLGNN
jgi:CRISPR/Cas system-associated exonuclease Cas4 (RecB family)